MLPWLGTAAHADPTGPCPASVGAPCVVVDVQSGTTVTSTMAFSAQDVLAAGDQASTDSYVVHTGKDRTIDPPSCATTAPATSLRSLVAQVVPDVGSVTFTDVRDSDGAIHDLAHGELSAPGDDVFPGGLPPVVCPLNDQSAQMLYLRTARDADDLNGAPGIDRGVFFAGAIHVTAHVTGSLLSPVIDATAQDPKHPGVISFSLEDAQPDYTYSWSFGTTGADDTSTLATPTHDYGTAAASYVVGLAVTSTVDGSYGQATIQVQVKDVPSSSDSPHPGSGSSTPTTTPSHTPSQVPTTPTTGSTAPGHDDPSTTAPTGVATTSPPTTTPTATTATTSATAAAGATGVGTPVGSLSTGPPPVSVPTVTLTPSSFLPPQDPVPTGAVVGVLLQAFDQPPAAATTSGSPDDPTPSVADPPDPRSGISPYLWLVLAIGSLLAAGAATEGRGFQAWMRRHRPWSRMDT